MEIKVSIVICTYNRSELLKLCLQSIIDQSPTDQIEIIVVDNNSTDDTEKIVSSFKLANQNMRLISEPIQGLSFARNTGYRAARGKWIGYIDDDAKITKGFFKRVFQTISESNFDCIGGMYYPWYERTKPNWIPENFGQKHLYSNTVCTVTEPRGFASGGIIFIKKSILEELKGFRTNFGMKGEEVGYGEETELQYRMWNKGYKIGFDPNLKILHLVNENKYKLRWHLRSTFEKSYATSRLSNPSIIQLLIWFVGNLGNRFFKTIPLSIINGEGYFKRLILFAMEPFLMFAGSLKSKIIEK